MERFDARWEHWLDTAGDWKPFFHGAAELTSSDLAGALRSFGLVTKSTVGAMDRLQPSAGGPAVQLPSLFSGPVYELPPRPKVRVAPSGSATDDRITGFAFATRP